MRPGSGTAGEEHETRGMKVTEPGLPALLLGVDTEADDQWSTNGRRRLEVRNAECLPGLQVLCDSYGVRPTYLVTHEMASGKESGAILKELAGTGRCEIGTHLHPWSSPPFREADLVGTYPSQLPDELLERQLRELTLTIEDLLGSRPTTYRAGRHGLDGRSLTHLECLGYTVDSSVDPLFNETRKGGPSFAGAPLGPYRPDYRDVRRPGSAKILEVPISAATLPRLPKPLERAYASLPPLPYRPALKRLGLRPVWLRPSYSTLADSTRLASRLVGDGLPCLNVLFHSSEILPGGSPYNPDPPSVASFLDRLERLFQHATESLGAVGRTYAEFAASQPGPGASEAGAAAPRDR